MGELRLDETMLATLEWELAWRSPEATHTERYLARRVNVWRDIFPRGMARRLAGLAVGETAESSYAPGEVVPGHDPARTRRVTMDRFERRTFLGRPLVPRQGRFLPLGLVRGLPGVFRATLTPFRVTALEEGAFGADWNHPLAACHLTLRALVANLAVKESETGGRLTDWAETVFDNGPGMQTRYSGLPTDFFDPAGFVRAHTDDAAFYAEPRHVMHVDAQAGAFLRQAYAERLRPGMRVLDLMSGRHSHLPEDQGLTATGLGMNAQEMAANEALAGHVVHDLNADPRLPFADAAFDACVCSLSVEYLERPLEVMAEAARVVRPGGLCLLGVSDRWFPPKVIALWRELHPFERLGFLLELLLRDGYWSDCWTLSVRNWWRPEEDQHIAQTWTSDPVFIAGGVRK